MFTPGKMEQIHVLFSDKDIQEVVDAVVRLGTIQMLDATEMEDWAETLTPAGNGEESSALRMRRERVESLMRDLDIPTGLEDISPSTEAWRDIDTWLEELESRLRVLSDQRNRVEEEIARLEELRNRVGGIPAFGFPLEGKEAYSYLTVETGRIADEQLEILKARLAPVLHALSATGSFGGTSTILVVGLRRDEEKIQSALRESGFQPMEPGKEAVLSTEALKELEEKMSNLRKEHASFIDDIHALARDSEQMLRSIYFRVLRDSLKERILKYFRKTEHTYLLSGWIPSEARSPFVQEIRRVTQNRCVIEQMPAEAVKRVREGKVRVPVQLQNPPLFKPFELITAAYGMPAYRTIDPTPVLGISFLLMFGMMFGDVGHGLVLTLVGVLLAFRGRKSTQKAAGMLLFYAGCASMGFGFLFGSIFGLEDLLPALWVKPMESITHLFKITIYFGIGMITLSIGINMINGIRKRDFLGVVFDKAGLLAAILYWCGIVVVTRMLSQETGSSVSSVIMILMLGAVILLFLREPIIQLARGRRELFPEGVATGIMGGIVEIIEIFLGFLTNTVSFIRVAAFGLAHVGLFMAVFSLSDAMSGVAGGVASWLVLILGNVLIICLEGLVVSIQAVRLEFYEFFNRFFEPGTVAYHPTRVEA